LKIFGPWQSRGCDNAALVSKSKVATKDLQNLRISGISRGQFKDRDIGYVGDLGYIWFMYCLCCVLKLLVYVLFNKHYVVYWTYWTFSVSKDGSVLETSSQTIEIILSCLQIIKLNMFHGNSMATLSRISIRRYLSWKQLRMVNGWKRPWESLKYFQVMCHEVGGSLVKTFQKVCKVLSVTPSSTTCRKESQSPQGAESLFVSELVRIHRSKVSQA